VPGLPRREVFLRFAEASSDALWAQGEALALDLRQRPDFIAADGLEPTATATTLRVRDGKVFVTDGPFAETKEQLAGFLLIDAPNLDEAIKVAARVPTAGLGSVEVRPTRDLERSHAGSLLKRTS
jgi:hypothetical protein